MYEVTSANLPIGFPPNRKKKNRHSKHDTMTHFSHKYKHIVVEGDTACILVHFGRVLGTDRAELWVNPGNMLTR